MRRGLVGLAVAAALLVGADVVAAKFAESQIAQRAQTAGRLSATPEVDVRGFPFLTQALRGRYDEVRVSASDVRGDGDVRLSRFEASLRGVTVDTGDALSGRVSAVPVTNLTATALLGYTDLAGDRPFRLSADGRRLRVTGAVRVLGRTLTATAVSSVRLDGRAVVVTAERYEVGSKPVDDVLSASLGGLLDLRLDIGGLPYGLELTGVQVLADGVQVRAAAGATVLSAG